MIFEYVGILDRMGEPVFLSELCSQIEGGDLDGPVVFTSIEEAKDAILGCGCSEDWGFCRIKLVIEEGN